MQNQSRFWCDKLNSGSNIICQISFNVFSLLNIIILAIVSFVAENLSNITCFFRQWVHFMSHIAFWPLNDFQEFQYALRIWTTSLFFEKPRHINYSPKLSHTFNDLMSIKLNIVSLKGMKFLRFTNCWQYHCFSWIVQINRDVWWLLTFSSQFQQLTFLLIFHRVYFNHVGNNLCNDRVQRLRYLERRASFNLLFQLFSQIPSHFWTFLSVPMCSTIFSTW